MESIMNQCLQLQIDEVTRGGITLRVESESVTIDKATGYEMQEVPAAVGDHGYTMKRVTPVVKFKLMTDELSLANIDLNKIMAAGEEPVTLRDSISGKRARISRSVFKTIGEIGKGAADAEIMILSKIQWL
jgi:hypothetical protein